MNFNENQSKHQTLTSATASEQSVSKKSRMKILLSNFKNKKRMIVIAAIIIAVFVVGGMIWYKGPKQVWLNDKSYMDKTEVKLMLARWFGDDYTVTYDGEEGVCVKYINEDEITKMPSRCLEENRWHKWTIYSNLLASFRLPHINDYGKGYDLKICQLDLVDGSDKSYSDLYSVNLHGIKVEDDIFMSMRMGCIDELLTLMQTKYVNSLALEMNSSEAASLINNHKLSVSYTKEFFDNHLNPYSGFPYNLTGEDIITKYAREIIISFNGDDYDNSKQAFQAQMDFIKVLISKNTIDNTTIEANETSNYTTIKYYNGTVTRAIYDKGDGSYLEYVDDGGINIKGCGSQRETLVIPSWDEFISIFNGL